MNIRGKRRAVAIAAGVLVCGLGVVLVHRFLFGGSGAAASGRQRGPLHLPEGVTLVHVPPGKFEMGTTRVGDFVGTLGNRLGGMNGFPREGPPHLVRISRGFYIGRRKIWSALYAEFLNDTGQVAPTPYWMDPARGRVRWSGARWEVVPGTEELAADFVTFEGASAFCDWLSRETGLPVRLPTEAEWEFVAAGPEDRRFPWGSDVSAAPFHVFSDADPLLAPSDADLKRYETPLGVQGMGIGVFEWVADWYREGYSVGGRPVVDPTGPASGTERVVRGPEPWSSSRTWGGDRWGIGFRVVVPEEAVGIGERRGAGPGAASDGRGGGRSGASEG